ncbi:ATP-binding protein [Methanobrevibacter filiformis]|uniref:Uncharacterized protein n=1 Tax=Methanobrevibacter filiformis TaxID=55758 RepID=A0A166CUQ2_9EURY|nr:AAA family ATPase [Methanobrevibacter filiformis]KZX14885.1 hypothetical protein MBFIL_07900 [Methanobrevibacter filiformis]
MNKNELIDYIYENLNEGPNVLIRRKTSGKNFPKFYRESFFKLKKHIDDFLDDFLENRFITLSGLRGLGKTTILIQIYKYLTNEKNISKDRILYINADDLEFIGITLYELIDTFIREIHETTPVSLDKKIFILIDEAHYDKNWSKVGKVFYDKNDNIFFIFTGSSTLSFEVNVDAVRRIKMEKIFPMNFQEYNRLKNNIKYPENYYETLNKMILSGENLDKMISKEHHLRKKFLNLDKPLIKEWENFLICGNFPFFLHDNSDEYFLRIFQMINKIIEKDVFTLKTFKTDSKSTISQIITYIGLQDPGGTSDKKLATILSKSPKTIREILNTLEKTRLLFSVRPYGSNGKIIRKPWKYYFSSASINASIRFKFGNFSIKNRKILGIFAETLVASYLFKLKEVENPFLNIYYDVVS